MARRKVILVATRRGKNYLIAAALIMLLTIFSCSLLTVFFLNTNVYMEQKNPQIDAPGQFLPEGNEIPIEIINESLQVLGS